MGCVKSKEKEEDEPVTEVSFSYDKLMFNFDNDADFVRMLVEEGMKEFRHGIDSMLDLLNDKSSKDLSELKMYAHSIKGSSGNICCLPMSEIAKQIEIMADSFDSKNYSKESAKIRHLVDKMNMEMYNINMIYRQKTVAE